MSHLENLNISDDVYAFCLKAEQALTADFQNVDRTLDENQWKILNAFQKHRVSERFFAATTGYGYGDDGRDELEGIYADVFHTEDALVRPQLISGTHALSTALFAVLRPGDRMVCATGQPYDTLMGVIGLRREEGSLKEFGVGCQVVPMNENGMPDIPSIKEAAKENTRLVEIQRSKGYTLRHSLSCEEIGQIIRAVRSVNPDAVIMVDNCYGEFTETVEPSDFGADLVVGSLIKNPGGGLAPIGGYIAGRYDLVEKCAVRLTAPGLGKEVGATLGINRELYQGLFMAPHVTAQALKTAMLAAEVFGRLGFFVSPGRGHRHYDIVEAITLNSPERLKAFCRGVQQASPVDSFVVPEPADMPGYDEKVISAVGSFIAGSSIELSADATVIEPYTVYFQGGLTYSHGKAGVMKALNALIDEGLVTLP